MGDTNHSRAYQHLSIALLVAVGFLIIYIATNINTSEGLFSFGSSSDSTLYSYHLGDDSHEFSANGLCSDTRFRGPGMGNILANETGTDSTDCALLFNEGTIFLASEQANLAIQAIEFGNDEGDWPNDKECDDPRFEGEGVAFSADDTMLDASDCRNLLYQGSISYVGEVEALSLDGIDFGDDLSVWSNDGECDDPRFSGDGTAATLQLRDAFHDASDCSVLYSNGEITYLGDTLETDDFFARGSLESSDEVFGETGEYLDSYFYEGLANQTVVFDLQSADFDTFLTIIAPDGEQFENDDFEGSTSWSQLSLDLTVSGTYEVMVTSYGSGETGSYTLQINSEETQEEVVSLAEEGSLEEGDEVRASGELMDTYEVTAIPGQSLKISLESEDFDTYLIVQSPMGEIFEDDDGLSGTDSFLEIDVAEIGTYEIRVSSYSADEVGQYSLLVLESVLDIPGIEE